MTERLKQQWIWVCEHESCRTKGTKRYNTEDEAIAAGIKYHGIHSDYIYGSKLKK
jgi:hypothetical protein